ncbi:conjugal transfer nickase/helicase domain-containing protein [Rhodanobacter lindaniclasticus]
MRFLDWRDGQMREGTVVAMKGHAGLVRSSKLPRTIATWAPLPYTALEPPAFAAQAPGLSAPEPSGEPSGATAKAQLRGAASSDAARRSVRRATYLNSRVGSIGCAATCAGSALAKQEEQSDWQWVQKRFERLQVHRKQPNGLNIWICDVVGPRKTRRHHGYRPTDPLLLFQNPPPNNPYLSLVQANRDQ